MNKEMNISQYINVTYRYTAYIFIECNIECSVPALVIPRWFLPTKTDSALEETEETRPF